MPEQVTIPIAIVDVVMQYARPSLKLVMERAKVVDALFENFRAWDIDVDDVDVITEGKPSEQGIKFKIPKLRTSFFFGASNCRLSQDDADWESAEETIAILNLGVGTLHDMAGIDIGAYKTAIALHLQPKVTSFIDIIRPFAAPQLLAIDGSAVNAFATVIKWENRRVTIDGSAQLANAIFLKFERDFPGAMNVFEIAAQLKTDEEELFRLLNVEEVRA